MSGKAKISLLCEDLQQACFVRRFLLNRGWSRYDIRESRTGIGSGEQRVRKEYPQMLKAYRSKANHLHNGLIVAIDADTNSVDDRIRSLDAACKAEDVPTRQNGERVMYVVSKRNIETWLAYLRGEPVDEETDRKRFKHHSESECYPQVDKLDEMCKKGRLEGDPPPSLAKCCEEFEKFWSLIKQ